MTREGRSRTAWLDFAIAMLVLVVIVVHATSWAFPLSWLGELLGFDAETVKKAPRLTLADVLIWIAGALLVLRMILRRDFRALRRLPLAGVLLTVLVLVSMFFAKNKLTAIAEVIQFVEYFVVLTLLLAAVLSTKDRLKLATTLWLTVGAVVVVWALVHYLDADRDALDVSGPFLNRNVLGGYLAMLLPLAWGLALCSGRRSSLVQAGVLVAAGFVVMLAGGPWLAAAAGVLVISTVRAPRLLPVLLGVFLIAVVVLFPLLPRDNAHVLAKSLDAYDSSQTVVEKRYSQRYIRWQACIRFLTPSYFEQDGRVYKAPFGIPRSRHLRYLLLGVGIGNYEKGLDEYFGDLPKPNENITEPDTQNAYLVLAFSAGVPAALALVWLLGGALRRSAWASRKTSDRFLGGLLLGCVGALVSLVIANVFTETLVHGCGPAMILVLTLSTSGARLAERERARAE